jgi:hypothetical protein
MRERYDSHEGKGNASHSAVLVDRLLQQLAEVPLLENAGSIGQVVLPPQMLQLIE